MATKQKKVKPLSKGMLRILMALGRVGFTHADTLDGRSLAGLRSRQLLLERGYWVTLSDKGFELACAKG